MKNLFSKIEFHYSFLIMALGLVLTGHFSNVFVFTSLIFVHEFGHVITAKIFGYKIDKINIYPYGGYTRLNTMVNTNIYKDLVVAISGIVSQCFCFFIVCFFYYNGGVREYIYNLFYLYHTSMLFFNLLPIIPLDGYRILNLIMSKFFNFNLSNNISVFISLCSIVFFLFSGMFDRNYSVILVVGILLKNIYTFYYQINFIYNKFLLERYLYNIDYKSKKVIRNGNEMYKNKSHLIINNNKIITEKVFLYNFFNKKQ